MKFRSQFASLVVFLLSTTGFVFAQSNFGKIEVVGSDVITAGRIVDYGYVRPGVVFSSQSINITNKKIIDDLQRDGYLFSRIDSVAISTPDTNTAQLTWYIYEGSQVLLGPINLSRDVFDYDLIYSQLDLNEGDVYSQELVESELLRINEIYARIYTF